MHRSVADRLSIRSLCLAALLGLPGSGLAQSLTAPAAVASMTPAAANSARDAKATTAADPAPWSASSDRATAQRVAEADAVLPAPPRDKPATANRPRLTGPLSPYILSLGTAY